MVNLPNLLEGGVRGPNRLSGKGMLRVDHTNSLWLQALPHSLEVEMEYPLSPC